VSGHFGTSTEVSKRHFGPKYRTVQPDGPNCAAILKSFTYKLAAKINSRRYGTKLCHSHPRYRYSIKSRNTALFVHAFHGITSFALSLMLDTTVCCCCPQKQRKSLIIIIDKTDAGLSGLCIRDITLIYDVINTYNNY